MKTLSLSKCNGIKMILMLIVIFYHCTNPFRVSGWYGMPAEPSVFWDYINYWLYNFHIYTFTFLSGYLFYYIRYEKGKYRTPIDDFKKRAKKILLPYMAMCLFWVLPFDSFIHGFTTKNGGFIKNYILAIAPAQYWFLIMIFTVFVIFYLISDYLEKKNAWLIMLAFYVLYGIAAVLVQKIPNIFQIFTSARYLLFFYFGFAVRKGEFHFLFRIPWYLYFILYTTLFTFDHCFLDAQNSGIFTLISSALTPIICLTGIMMVVTTLSCIPFDKLEKLNFVRLLEKYNFPMYLLHQQILYVCAALLIPILPSYLFVPFAFLVVVTLSFLVALLFSRFNLTKIAIGI